LWQLRRDGEIEFLRIGVRPFFAASQIDAYQRRKLGGDKKSKQVAKSAESASFVKDTDAKTNQSARTISEDNSFDEQESRAHRLLV
jgi:hypothetical protein